MIRIILFLNDVNDEFRQVLDLGVDNGCREDIARILGDVQLSKQGLIIYLEKVILSFTMLRRFQIQVIGADELQKNLFDIRTIHGEQILGSTFLPQELSNS